MGDGRKERVRTQWPNIMIKTNNNLDMINRITNFNLKIGFDYRKDSIWGVFSK